jgi:hypothetical protein
MLEELLLGKNQIDKILEFISIGGNKSNKALLSYLNEMNINNHIFKQGLEELSYTYENLIHL